jgi:predicted dehydrogenase
MQHPISFGIIGGGWRSTFFLHIARALPERFRVAGMAVRDAEKGAALERTWNIPTVRTLDDLLKLDTLAFIVVSVPWSAAPPILAELARHNMPTLTETPPAPDIAGLQALQTLVKTGAKIQVAEQYQFQPLHAARISLTQSGKLGTISQAQVSIAHGYHGISLMRKLLNVGIANPNITAHTFVSPIIAGPDRLNPPDHEEIKPSKQILATLNFGTEKLGIFDFNDDQYHSWIRSPRLLVRGERGEINNTEVRYLQDFRTPITLNLLRQNAGENGNLEGYYLKGILAGAEWLYLNPFTPGRLNDDEIAIATCLEKMAQYVDGGPAFYDLAEAAQDHYLSIMINQAAQSGKVVHANSAAYWWGQG